MFETFSVLILIFFISSGRNVLLLLLVMGINFSDSERFKDVMTADVFFGLGKD